MLLNLFKYTIFSNQPIPLSKNIVRVNVMNSTKIFQIDSFVLIQ